jgi:hypothetical protein
MTVGRDVDAAICSCWVGQPLSQNARPTCRWKLPSNTALGDDPPATDEAYNKLRCSRIRALKRLSAIG